jgi:hypothetical protein
MIPGIVASGHVTATFDPRTQVTALHGIWADDPDWTNPGDGGAVSSIRNFAGTPDPSQATSTAKPTFRATPTGFNGHAALEFDGGDSDLGAVTDVAQPWKIVAVVKRTGSGNRNAVGFLSAGARGLGHNSGGAWLLSAGTNLTGGTSDTTAAHVLRGTLNGASSQLWADGTSVASGDAGANALGDLVIGAPSASGWVGFVAFVGIYAGSTSDTDLAALCADLATYYGI